MSSNTTHPAGDASTTTDGVFATVTPGGFVDESNRDGILLRRVERSPTPASFLSSIVVHPIEYRSPGSRTVRTDPAECQTDANEALAVVRQIFNRDAEAAGHQIVQFPAGVACQYEIHIPSATEPHSAIGTVLQSDAGDRSIVCNLAVGDDVGRAGCMSFLESWVWLPARSK